jgi:hypothetical protein
VLLPFERLDLVLGQDDPVLGDLLLERREAMLEGLEVVPHPHAANTSRRDMESALAELVGDSNLPKGRFVDGQGDNRFLDLGSRTVPEVRPPTGLIDQGLDAAFVDRLLVAVERVSGIAHDLAGPRDVPELFGQVQQADLVLDDLLYCTHGGLPFWRTGLRLCWCTTRVTPSLDHSRVSD